MEKLVFIENKKVVTDSLTVAEVFGKTHDNVMRDIRNQLDKLKQAGEAEWGVLNFEECDYINDSASGINKNRKYRKFNMSEDAFAIIAMSYVTPEAMKMKIKFLSEFKRMKEELQKQLQPTSQAELIAMLAQYNVDQEKRLATVEERVEQTAKQQENITEILSLNPTEWRKKVNKIITSISVARGGYGAYSEVRSESYKILEERARCLLSKRLTNKRQKMALEGVSKSRIDKVNYMDVIADDARLTEIYLAVVKEMAIKHGVDIKSFGKGA